MPLVGVKGRVATRRRPPSDGGVPRVGTSQPAFTTSERLDPLTLGAHSAPKAIACRAPSRARLTSLRTARCHPIRANTTTMPSAAPGDKQYLCGVARDFSEQMRKSPEVQLSQPLLLTCRSTLCPRRFRYCLLPVWHPLASAKGTSKARSRCQPLMGVMLRHPQNRRHSINLAEVLKGEASTSDPDRLKDLIK
jgi:hypothetical protein